MNEMIKKRRDKLALKEGYIGLLVRIMILASIGVLLFTQVFLIARVKGNEMFPAIKDGDLVLAFRLEQNYEKNDLISYKLDGRRR
ncbi:MAG: signal peptidase I, partial [Tissierellia bacterium]|nr:signal peptidase I [Tissierellia bacterium]